MLDDGATGARWHACRGVQSATVRAPSCHHSASLPQTHCGSKTLAIRAVVVRLVCVRTLTHHVGHGLGSEDVLLFLLPRSSGCVSICVSHLMSLLRSGHARCWRERAARWLVATSTLIALTGANDVAHAQDAVRVDVPPECGSEQEFLSEVARLQGPASAPLAVSRVTISRRDPQNYELTLTSNDERRVVVDSDCATLFRTAVVIAATLGQLEGTAPTPAADALTAEASKQPLTPPLQTDATTAELGATSPTPSQPTQADRAAAPEPAGSQPTPLTSRTSDAPLSRTTASEVAREQDGDGSRPVAADVPLALQLGVGGAAFLGLSPSPHVGFEALAGVTRNRWGGHLALRLLPPRSMLVRERLGLRETVWGVRASASHLPVPWLAVSLGLSGYWISAEGLGISDPVSDGVGLLAPELELAALVLSQSAVRAEIGLQGRLGLTRPRFEVDSRQVVYQLPRLGAAAVLRILWTDR